MPDDSQPTETESSGWLDQYPSVEGGRTELIIYVLARHTGQSVEEARVAAADFENVAEKRWHNLAHPSRREIFEVAEEVLVAPYVTESQ